MKRVWAEVNNQPMMQFEGKIRDLQANMGQIPEAKLGRHGSSYQQSSSLPDDEKPEIVNVYEI
jgi:hypothetical protein